MAKKTLKELTAELKAQQKVLDKADKVAENLWIKADKLDDKLFGVEVTPKNKDKIKGLEKDKKATVKAAQAASKAANKAYEKLAKISAALNKLEEQS